MLLCLTVCVCLYVCLHLRAYVWNYRTSLHQIFVAVTYGSGSLLWWHCNTLCILVLWMIALVDIIGYMESCRYHFSE